MAKNLESHKIIHIYFIPFFFRSNTDKGDLVNWETAQWDVKNMIINEVTYDDICKSQELGQVIFPGYRNYTTALALCQNVGGTLLQIETEAQQNLALELMKTSSTCSDISVYGAESTWIAWWDHNQEGEWSSSINSSKLLETNDFQPWEPGEPNGETIENCAALKQTGIYRI